MYKVLLLNVEIMAFKILTTIGSYSTRQELMKCCRGICHFKDVKSCNVDQEKRQRVLSKTLLLNKITKKSYYSRETKDAGVADEQSIESCFIPRKTLLTSLSYILEGIPEFETKLNCNSTLTDEEWNSVRENALQSPFITEINRDSQIINACLALNNTNAVISYYKYLKNNGYDINLAVERKYLSIFSRKKDSLTLSDKLEITQLYDNLRKKYPQLDELTASICISNMCATDRWKEVEDLIKEVAEYNSYISHIYSDFACAAFVNGEPDIGWKYTRLFCDNQLIPNNILESYIKYCKKYVQDGKDLINEIEKMFQFLGENRIYTSVNVITLYMNVLRELNWSVQNCRISKLGKCSSCGTHLEMSTLSNEELHLLTDSVIKNLVHGSDLFQNTNPRELQNFHDFVWKTKPYDIVIDGLNLFYLQKNKFQTVIQHLIQQKKKILLIMRKHLIRNRKLLKIIQNNTYYFAAEDISKDDPYLIYATLASGKDTYFLSSDLMRSQLHQMKSLQLKTIFKKWLTMRRLQVNRSLKYGVVSQPYTYVPYVQKNGSCWHIPYLEKELQFGEVIFCDSIKWLCLRPKQ